MSRRFDPHNPVPVQIRAVRDVYLMSTPDKQDTAWAVLSSAADASDRLIAACQELDPKGVCTTNRNIRDDMVVPLTVTMGELRRFRTALADAMGQAVSK